MVAVSTIRIGEQARQFLIFYGAKLSAKVSKEFGRLHRAESGFCHGQSSSILFVGKPILCVLVFRGKWGLGQGTNCSGVPNDAGEQ